MLENIEGVEKLRTASTAGLTGGAVCERFEEFTF